MGTPARARLGAAAALLLGALHAAAVTLLPASREVVIAVDDFGQLLAALTAAAACAAAAVRGRLEDRRGWGLLAAGIGCWAAGQAVWTWYEVALGREVPFPSLSDVGFLLFPVVASAGLVLWLRGGAAAARVRDLLDATLIAGSLLALSWFTTLGAVYDAGAESLLGLVLSLAYPLSDAGMATLVLLMLVRVASRQRAVLWLVAGGLGGLALADSAYVHLMTTGSYSSGSVVSAGWVAGFLLLAAGALCSLPGRGQPVHHGAGRSEAQTTSAPVSWVPSTFPYVALIAAEACVAARLLAVPGVQVVDLALGSGLAAVVLLRQFLASWENRRLLVELGAARDLLRHQAWHDPVTGLPNRILFSDRLIHALAVRRAARRPLALLFCDLDDFKTVNDALGHGAGDTLLGLVAERMSSCIRPADTVARLGGDEFAVLLEGDCDPLLVAERLIAAVGQEFALDGVPTRVSLSVGIALSPGGEAGPAAAEPTPEQAGRELLQRADGAMYLAKSAGKGRAVLVEGSGLLATGAESGCETPANGRVPA